MEASLAAGRQLLWLRALQYGAAFLSGVTIARSLGPEGRASYALALNFASIVLVASHLSVEFSATRLLSRGEATMRQLSRMSMTAAIVLGSAGTAVAVAAGLALRTTALAGASAWSVALASATIAPSIGNLVVVAILLRRGATLAYGLIQVGQGALQLGLLVVATQRGGLSPEAVLAINLAVTSASFAAAGAVLGRQLGWRALLPSRDLALLGRVVRTGLALHGASVAVYLNLRIDLFLVGVLLSSREAGLYSLAVNLAGLCALAMATMGLAALKDQAELDERAAVAFTVAFTRRTLLYAAGFACVAAALSQSFISVTYGSEWKPAAGPFALLTAGAVALAIETPARGLLLRIGRPWTISAAAITAMIVNVLTNLWLIPRLGLTGAAIAAIASYSTAALLTVLLLRQEVRR